MGVMLDYIRENIFSSVFSFLIGSFLTWIWVNRGKLKILGHSIVHMKSDYRISAAYLFKIKVYSKYLLIKGNRIDQYQPIGGVYKYNESFRDTYNKLQIRCESNGSFYEKNDLRVYVKGKYLTKFLTWYGSMRNREITVHREFFEEMVQTGIIDKDDFFNLDFEFIRKINSGIHYSVHFKCDEILLFDIYEVFLTQKSLESVKQVADKNKNIILVEYDDIERECTEIGDKSYKISENSKYLR